MKIDLRIGVRDTALNFLEAYQKNFLYWHGFAISDDLWYQQKVAVRTKNGMERVKPEDVVTYVGDGVWSVAKKEK